MNTNLTFPDLPANHPLNTGEGIISIRKAKGLTLHPADYLGHRYYPEYRGAFHGEFPHIAICDRHHHDTIITRTYHSPDRFAEAWNTACHQADTLNNQ